ncbi:ATP-binding protein [Aeromicrobium sp.]|nr:ATP-binding protein [Candidatus Saccharibacteria bacterium]
MSKVLPAKPLFIMLYGFPGAGKTYFARQLCENVQAAHVQGDRIRGELFTQPRWDAQENSVTNQLMEYMAGEFLAAGVSVVYDTNAMRTSQRRALRDMAHKSGATPVVVWFQIDLESAFARTAKRDRRRNDDRFAAPMSADAFKNIVRHMQNPEATEQHIVISGKHLFSTQMAAMMKRLHELKLISGEDMTHSIVKPGMVNLVPQRNAGRVDQSRRNIIIR